MHLVKLYICILSALFLFQTPQVSESNLTDYKQLFNRAEKLSNSATPSGKTDKEALSNYLKVVRFLSANHIDDHFLFKADISTATFLQVLNRQRESVIYLKNAISLKKQLPDIRDSAFFKPLVYCGNAYYQLDQPDSAAIYYSQAEHIADEFPKVSELERLYNTLGVIAYSSGNYNQSVTYYQKAISTLTAHRVYVKAFLVVYQNNLASALKKLKRYDEALKIYQGLLPFGIETDALLHNIGSAYLAMGKYAEAIQYLNKVKYNDQKKFNDLGRAYFREKDYADAAVYLQKAADLNTNNKQGHKITDYGITLKYFGDLWFEKGQTLTALSDYQKSINNLVFGYRNADIYNNPATFTSVFNTMELLETLKAKAIAFKKMYSESGKVKDLDASLQTYQAFYKLANYVERVYDNDESRLLITDKKYASHQQPIEICLQLFGLTRNRAYVEQAFRLDEENKANVLSLYLREAKLKAGSRIPQQWLQQETVLKRTITKITLGAADEKDSLKLAKLNSQLNEYAINLLKVQKKIDEQTKFGRLKFQDNGFSVKAVQDIIPAGSAILSYHMLDNSVICFVITNKAFEFFQTRIPVDFESSLKQLYEQAQFREGNNRIQLKQLTQYFYHLLLKQAEQYITRKNDLMIIPDGGLNYIPFEILADEHGDNLLDHFTVTYNYSCSVLQNGASGSSTLLNTIGMAPFANRLPPGTMLSSLPASKAEIEALKGTRLFGENASKQQFVANAHNFNIIHLATHAVADDRDPNRSFIAFYPTKPDSAMAYKLFLPEIYNLKLDKTRLVVLSACESGVGELINGEGLISLSRAFSYSGCDNIITSMWKADDASTAYISERLHFYLQKGNSIAWSLREAKLDYLNDDHIAATQKQPGYWAHFRLIGGFEVEHESYTWLIYLVVVLLAALLIIKNRSVIRNWIPLRMK